jgi:hypothetical protein
MEWVCVKDLRPFDGQVVMTYQTYPKGTMFKADCRPLNRTFHKVLEYSATYGFWDHQQIPYEYITHWMPLPQPPKE